MSLQIYTFMPYKTLVYKQMTIRVIVCHCVALAALGSMGKEEWNGKGKEKAGRRTGKYADLRGGPLLSPPSFGL
uniref:Uncharacterized protein n=1 Tax=Prevotella sp. GTC17253 TaxID=3236793 RepID=A0AB33IT22_9BACT